MQGHRNGIVNTQKRCSLPLSTLGRIYRDVCNAIAQKSCGKDTTFPFWITDMLIIRFFYKLKLFQDEKKLRCYC